MKIEKECAFEKLRLMDEQKCPQNNVLETKFNEVLEACKRCNKDGEINQNEQIIVFIGDSKYPNRKNNAVTNVSPFGLYKTLKFSEVAFMCDGLTLEMCSIMAILFGSMDIGAHFAKLLLFHGLVDNFCRYLLYVKHVFLVNFSNQTTQLENLFGRYKNHLVFKCNGQGSEKEIKDLLNLNTDESNEKYNCIFEAIHPSSKSYIHGFVKACETYLTLEYCDNKSNLKLNDFKVF